MISDDGAGGMEQKMPESDFQPNYDTGHHHVSENDSSHPCGRVKIEGFEVSPERHVDRAFDPSAISIEVSQSVDILERKVGSPRIVISEADLEVGRVSNSKTTCLPKSESYREQCRVCQQQTEEVLVDLGCRCSGDLAKAHRSCIELWFRTKGSNKCEICQQTIGLGGPIQLMQWGKDVHGCSHCAGIWYWFSACTRMLLKVEKSADGRCKYQSWLPSCSIDYLICSFE